MWELLQYRGVYYDFISGCDENMRVAIEQRVDMLRMRGNMAKEPVSKPVEKGIFECRARAGRTRARLLYFFQPGRKIVVVAALYKAQRKLDRKDIELALARKQKIESGLEQTHVAHEPN